MSRLLEFLERHKGPFKTGFDNISGRQDWIIYNGHGFPIGVRCDGNSDAALIADLLNAAEAMVKTGITPQMVPNGWTVKDFPRKKVTDEVRKFRQWAAEQEFSDPIAAVLAAKQAKGR